MPAKKEVKWVKSPAKAYLLDLIRKREIPEDMKPKQVYDTYCKHREEFLPFGAANFGSRLRSLRSKVTDQDDRAKRDAAALTRDRTIFPRPLMDGFGLAYWPDEEAKQMMEQDVREGKHNTMTKEQLFFSRPEYSECLPYKIFVKRVHQEVKTQKFHLWVDDKRNNKISEAHIENMPFAK